MPAGRYAGRYYCTQNKLQSCVIRLFLCPSIVADSLNFLIVIRAHVNWRFIDVFFEQTHFNWISIPSRMTIAWHSRDWDSNHELNQLIVINRKRVPVEWSEMRFTVATFKFSECSRPVVIVVKTQKPKRKTKMEFAQSLDSFIRWFYACGLSCYPSFGGLSVRKAKNKRLANYIPTVVLMALTIAISMSIIVTTIWDRDSMCLREFAIILITTLIPMLTVIVFAAQVVFLSPHSGNICLLIKIFDGISMQKIAFDAKCFKRQFMGRVYVVLFAFALPFLFKMCFYKWATSAMVLCHFPLRVILLLIFIQTFFYIELLDHMLNCFVRHIEEQTTMKPTVETITVDDSSVQQLRIEIIQFEQMHFRLWSISEEVGKLFGWMIVIIGLQYSAWAIHNVFEVFRLFFVKGFAFHIGGKLGSTGRWLPNPILTFPFIC